MWSCFKHSIVETSSVFNSIPSYICNLFLDDFDFKHLAEGKNNKEKMHWGYLYINWLHLFIYSQLAFSLAAESFI